MTDQKANREFAIWQQRNYPYGTPHVPLDGILLKNDGKDGYEPLIFPWRGTAEAEAKRLNEAAAVAPLAVGQIAPTEYDVIQYNAVYVIVYEPANCGDATVERFVGPDGDLVGKNWKAKKFSCEAAAKQFIHYELSGACGDVNHSTPTPKEAYNEPIVRHVY